MLQDKAPIMLEEETQADEIYIGGKEKNKHKSKRAENTQGRSTETKTPVVGLYSEGNVRTFVVETVDKEVLQDIIETAVKKDTMVVTDGFKSYLFLDKEYKHIIVNHNEGEYVNGGFHTNGMENFWSLLRRSIIGVYHHVSPEYLAAYCNEQSYHYNTRKVTDIQTFESVIKRADTARITYEELIAR